MAVSYPSEHCFSFARNVCVSKLQELSEDDLRAILPSLVRMSQCPSLDESTHWQEARKEIQKLLCGMEVVNLIVGLLSVDFCCLRQDCLKEKQMQRKLDDNGSSSHSALIEASKEGLALDFERSESSRRLRLVLRELLRVINKVYQIYACSMLFAGLITPKAFLVDDIIAVRIKVGICIRVWIVHCDNPQGMPVR